MVYGDPQVLGIQFPLGVLFGHASGLVDEKQDNLRKFLIHVDVSIIDVANVWQ